MKSVGVVLGRFAALACMGLLPCLASAVQIAYEKSQFEAALAQRDGFVVALVTDWCTTCSRQEAVVAELLERA